MIFKRGTSLNENQGSRNNFPSIFFSAAVYQGERSEVT